MTRQQIEDLVARRERAINQRDTAAFAALYAEDAVIESPTAGGTVQGRPAIAKIADAWFSGFPDMKFRSRSLLIDGDQAVTVGEMHGTDSGGFMDLPPTNKPFLLQIVFLSKVKDGLIVHEQPIYDFTGLLIQIGVLKAKPV
jgi:steroid delta-isomerase-like uncharacterized protein